MEGITVFCEPIETPSFCNVLFHNQQTALIVQGNGKYVFMKVVPYRRREGMKPLMRFESGYFPMMHISSRSLLAASRKLPANADYLTANQTLLKTGAAVILRSLLRMNKKFKKKQYRIL